MVPIHSDCDAPGNVQQIGRNSGTDGTFPDLSANYGARRYSFLTSPTNKLIIFFCTIAHGAFQSGNARPELQGPEARSHNENGPHVYFGKVSQRTDNEQLAGP